MTEAKPAWGQNTPTSDTSDYNSQQFLINQATRLISTATLVKVESVTTTGQIGPTGMLDVTPLVNLIDGRNNATKHGVVHNLIYSRMQGGNKAIILDPKVGDIGLAVFADRDISAVKKNKAQSPPGSRRRFDMADGIYVMTVLGGAPTCYIEFTDDDQIIVSPDNGVTEVKIKKNYIRLKIDDLKITMSPNRIDLDAEAGDGTSRVLTVDGPCRRVWSIPE